MSGSKTSVAFQSGTISQQSISEYSGVTFDASTNTYTVTYFPSAGGPGSSTDPTVTRTLTYAPGDVVSNTSNLTVYQHTDPIDATKTDRLSVSKLGSGNTEIALTYTNFAIQEVASTGNNNFLERDYIVFGSPAATLPTTGSATYNGVVEGTYSRPGTGIFLMTGTSTLTANFGAGNLTTSLNFTGNNVLAGQPGLPAQTFSGTGTITANNPGSQFNGTMTGMGLPGTVGFLGSFYGPNAQEFGYTFLYSGQTDQFNGVTVGKR